MDRKNTKDSENTLSHIPSYIRTIKALAKAKSCASRAATANSNETSILVVVMPITPKYKLLSGAVHEKLAIQQMARNFSRINALETPTAKRVLKDMSGFDIVHFACHGSADLKEPSNCHLLLQKSGPAGPMVDKLTVSEILKSNTLGNIWIAYLAACSSAGIEVTNIADECVDWNDTNY